MTESVGVRIRRTRLELGLTQEAFAKRLGTDRGRVIRWEGDKNHPGPLYRQKLAELSGRPVDEFVNSRPSDLDAIREELNQLRQAQQAELARVMEQLSIVRSLQPLAEQVSELNRLLEQLAALVLLREGEPPDIPGSGGWRGAKR